MATTEVLKQRLEEAEEARHQLAIGKKTVSIGYEGRNRTFSQATMAELEKYIRDLEQKINGGRARSRPIGF